MIAFPEELERHSVQQAPPDGGAPLGTWPLVTTPVSHSKHPDGGVPRGTRPLVTAPLSYSKYPPGGGAPIGMWLVAWGCTAPACVLYRLHIHTYYPLFAHVQPNHFDLSAFPCCFLLFYRAGQLPARRRPHAVWRAAGRGKLATPLVTRAPLVTGRP